MPNQRLPARQADKCQSAPRIPLALQLMHVFQGQPLPWDTRKANHFDILAKYGLSFQNPQNCNRRSIYILWLFPESQFLQKSGQYPCQLSRNYSKSPLFTSSQLYHSLVAPGARLSKHCAYLGGITGLDLPPLGTCNPRSQASEKSSTASLPPSKSLRTVDYTRQLWKCKGSTDTDWG